MIAIWNSVFSKKCRSVAWKLCLVKHVTKEKLKFRNKMYFSFFFSFFFFYLLSGIRLILLFSFHSFSLFYFLFILSTVLLSIYWSNTEAYINEVVTYLIFYCYGNRSHILRQKDTTTRNSSHYSVMRPGILVQYVGVVFSKCRDWSCIY